jgi:transposase
MKQLNDFVPAGHPLRSIRDVLNVALERMDEEFARMYSAAGRQSIAPEKLMRALILQVL